MSNFLSFFNFNFLNRKGKQDVRSDTDIQFASVRQALLKLSLFLTKQKIGLVDFYKQQKKDTIDFNEMVEEIIFSLQEGAEFPYNSLAAFIFHKITRMQCLETHLEQIQQEFFRKKRAAFPLKTRKMLIWTLLNNCTEELRLQLLLLLSQFCPIPLLSLSETQDNPFGLKYSITPEIYWILKPMPAMLWIDIGTKKHTKTINEFFGTDFDEDSFLDCGSVDIQFDLNFKSPRGFSVLKTDQNIQKNSLCACVRFSSIYMMTLHFDDFEYYLPTIRNFYERIEEYAQDPDEKLFFLIITGLRDQDFLFDEEASNTFKQQYGLENLIRLNIFALPDKDYSNSKTISNMTKKSIIQGIQQYLTSKSPKVMNHMEFLENFQITNYGEENQLVEDFLKTIEDNSENF